MSIPCIDEKLKYEPISPTEGLFILEDVKEGVGTTYGTVLRRAIIHTDSGYDVIGICVNEGKATSIFGAIDAMKNTVLDMCKVIKKAKYIVKENAGNIVEIGFSGNVSEVRLKDLATDLVSIEDGDKLVCAFTREVPVDIRVLLNNETGASSDSFNREVIKNYSGDENKWIVLDSCHGDVVTVSFNSEVELGMETVKLRIKTKNKKPIDVVNVAIKDLINDFNQISSNLRN